MLSELENLRSELAKWIKPGTRTARRLTPFAMSAMLAAAILPLPSLAQTPSPDSVDTSPTPTVVPSSSSGDLLIEATAPTWELLYSSSEAMSVADTGTNIVYNSRLLAKVNTGGNPFKVIPLIVIDSSGHDSISSGGGIFVESGLPDNDPRFARMGIYAGLRRNGPQGWRINLQLGYNPVRDTKDILQITENANLSQGFDLRMDADGVHGSVSEAGASDEARKPLTLDRSIVSPEGDLLVSGFSTKAEKTTVTSLAIYRLIDSPSTK